MPKHTSADFTAAEKILPICPHPPPPILTAVQVMCFTLYCCYVVFSVPIPIKWWQSGVVTNACCDERLKWLAFDFTGERFRAVIFVDFLMFDIFTHQQEMTFGVCLELGLGLDG